MRLKFLLRPGWIALILLAGVFSTVCFTLLAPWQFDRHAETQARNAAIRESMHAPTRPLREVLPDGRSPGADTEWMTVTFRGHYLPRGETLAWQRTVLGEPAFEVLTPFRLDSGATLLVNRGYIRPVEATRAPDYAAPPQGRVTLAARIRSNEQDAEQRPTFRHDGHLWTYAVNSRTVSEGTGIPMRAGYFSLIQGQPGVLSPLPLPRLESGPYFSYAMQWIIFGTMAPLGVVYLTYTEWRRASGSTGSPSGPSTDRYGGRSKRRRMSVAEAIAEDERREQAAHSP
ncbi:cytochrome oxidase assembly protein ShyY1 [Halopolyspora algeriensis]|uniref:SURF1-like protein n=1 Tax=Halopolyspora algeriensis TaxID=1500506 RepID=A0A368VHQ6_9ACTN|nr:SURF1 family cytochrome oxidase biogenesis protein [Halopolyspora algeriensis]RCW40704.1 cytochrome oxidase assembly protein ShyY1 [Halopolyspora algeriensis]TQM53373.1 cytochrome oxidase assembly protein ShyY1 [Halopolyspora algeriensis]